MSEKEKPTHAMPAGAQEKDKSGRRRRCQRFLRNGRYRGHHRHRRKRPALRKTRRISRQPLSAHAILATRNIRHFDNIAKSVVNPWEQSLTRNILFRLGGTVLQAALKAMNRLVADGVIQNYAIGGAIGASFYLPAMQTEDIDVFVFLPAGQGLLVSLTPVYDALKTMGGIVEREYVRFADWPLQILTDANPLIVESIHDAVEVDYEGIPTRVFRPEHLCAIALQTGRSKDYARVILFLEQNEVNRQRLSELVSRYGLTDRLQSALDSLQQGKAEPPR